MMNTLEFTLGDRLRKAREHAGLTVKEMGAVLGVSAGTVSAYENDLNKRPPSRAVLVLWSQTTDVDLAWIEGVTQRYPSTEQVIDLRQDDDQFALDLTPFESLGRDERRELVPC